MYTQEQDEYFTQLNEAKTKQDLYSIAGFLNNHPNHIHADKVSFMALLDFDEAVLWVENMIIGLK